MTTTEIFKRMIVHLLDSGMADKRVCIAQKAGVSEVQLSRAMNGRVKSVKEYSMRKVNAAYGSIFNPAWMRGESDVMLVADLKPKQEEPQKAPDMSSLINAVIAANDQAITSLKRELAAKDETIAELRGRLVDKEEIIRQHEIHVKSLEQQLLGLRVEKGVSAGRTLGAAERDSAQPRV